MTRVIPLKSLCLACPDQLRIVRREWPHGIPLTEDSARRAVELNLDIEWAASKLLTERELIAFDTAKRRRFNEWAVYKMSIATALLEILKGRQ